MFGGRYCFKYATYRKSPRGDSGKILSEQFHEKTLKTQK